MSEFDQVKNYLQSLQNRIVAELEQLDGKQTFRRDAWERAGGGGGESRVLIGGRVFEQGGVNFSHVFGNQLPPSATKTRPDLAGQGFLTQRLITHDLITYRRFTYDLFTTQTTVKLHSPND